MYMYKAMRKLEENNMNFVLADKFCVMNLFKSIINETNFT